jgi:hypothetical protein
MDNVALGAIIAVIVSGMFANYISSGMASQVRQRNGRKHIPVALNFRLARSYRELFGSDGKYWQFMVLNGLYSLGLLVFAVSSLIHWLRG